MENKKYYIIFGIFLASIICGIVIIAMREKTGYVESPVKSAIAGDRGIYVINIYGLIRFAPSSGIFSHFSSYDRLVRKLRKISYDPKVTGVLLRINSPGGTVGCAQEVYEEIARLRKNGKTVYASFGDIAGSAAYYIASASDKIYTNPGTITGSIGVITELGNLTELMKKIGVKFEVIKSGKYKDIGNMFREATPEERKMLQELIDRSYEQFVRAVAEGRKMPIDKVKEIADGRIVLGEQAKELNLVDEIGNSQDAMEALWKKIGGTGQPRIIRDAPGFESFLDAVSFPYEDSKMNISDLLVNKWMY